MITKHFPMGHCEVFFHYCCNKYYLKKCKCTLGFVNYSYEGLLCESLRINFTQWTIAVVVDLQN